jgi:hypothetical protein
MLFNILLYLYYYMINIINNKTQCIINLILSIFCYIYSKIKNNKYIKNSLHFTSHILVVLLLNNIH